MLSSCVAPVPPVPHGLLLLDTTQAGSHEVPTEVLDGSYDISGLGDNHVVPGQEHWVRLKDPVSGSSPISSASTKGLGERRWADLGRGGQPGGRVVKLPTWTPKRERGVPGGRRAGKPRRRSYISQPTCGRRAGRRAEARGRSLTPGLRLQRPSPAPPPRPSSVQPGQPSRAPPRRAERSRAVAAPRRRFKRSAGPWPGAAVVRPAPRSSPLFPPWFLSAPASNLAPGAPLARTSARRTPPRTAPHAAAASRPLPTALAAQAGSPLPPPPPSRKVKFEEGGRGEHGHEEEDPPGAEEPDPGSCSRTCLGQLQIK
ncbi:formin-like protein 5 [Nannospalax galili]|uniref:formin-like protein 5 n=1 Tax=Nannospalax galili TaxID=1026970 RepID=UPI000819AD0D|nr:formin-like protein 5 [Nannospalax galili]